MKRKTSVAALIVVLGVAGGVQAADRSDKDRIQGHWTTMIGPNKDITLTLSVEGDALTVSYSTQNGQPQTLKGELKLDEKADPKAMDWVKMTNNGSPLDENLAIYRFVDDDTLQVRGMGLDKKRPVDFSKEAQKGRPQTLTLKRKKDEPKKDEAKKDK